MDTPISRVAVVGAGYMGTGILQVLAMSQVTCMVVGIDAATTQTAYRACLDLAADYERRAYFPAGAAAAIEQHSLVQPRPISAECRSHRRAGGHSEDNQPHP
jgi:3-hydroxybutyryl-CoA dehydrogenase